ncbi:hypothetical protein VPHK392_0021 [Vibrio phage K392]
MNKLLKMVDKPSTIRGKILKALIERGPLTSNEVATLTGLTPKVCNTNMYDMLTDSAYIILDRKKFGRHYQYNLLDLKCKMTEARTVKSPRISGNKSNGVPCKKWSEVFGLMDTCIG